MIFSFLLLSVNFLQAQEHDTTAAKLAHHMADKMKDSLGLNDAQRSEIFSINMELHRQKSEARSESNDRDIVGKNLQKIEGKRNNLYKNVLTTEQFALYFKKKRDLISSK